MNELSCRLIENSIQMAAFYQYCAAVALNYMSSILRDDATTQKHQCSSICVFFDLEHLHFEYTQQQQKKIEHRA